MWVGMLAVVVDPQLGELGEQLNQMKAPHVVPAANVSPWNIVPATSDPM